MSLALLNKKNHRESNRWGDGRWRFLLAWLLILSSGSTLASQGLDTLRHKFLEAERVLATGDLERYQTLRPSLKRYPLYPYLEFQALRLQLPNLDSSQVDAFLTTYANTPLAGQLRQQWLTELAEQRKWWTYLVFYQPGQGITLRCHYLRALLETGKVKQAFDQTPAIWLYPHSRPGACDPALETWINAGGLTPTLAWKRIELAMQASEGRLARYLQRYLSTEQQNWLQAWQALQREPGLVIQSQPRLAASPARNTILLDGFKHLIRRDIKAAITAWDKLQSQYHFSAQEQYHGTRSLLLGLIHSDHQDALAVLQTVIPNNRDQYLHVSRIRYALKKQAWGQVLSWIDQLPAALKRSDRWRYWRARALAQTGAAHAAQAVFIALTKSRSYHGFLAADRLNQAYRYNAIPLDLKQSAIDQLARRPALMRARELFQLGRFIDARREWQMAVRHMNQGELKQVSKLAQSWGWHDRAIFTLARTGYWDDLELRFPLEHRALIEEATSTQDLDAAWVFAVIRQESAFSSDAQSPTGAMGLMQLMPSTARYIAKKKKLESPGRHQLTIPALNITLGTAYLNHVYQQLGGHQVLATAAYNAGPRNVLKWLPEATLPADIWIELIPYNETRRYTERVLSYAAIYDQRLHQPLQRLSARMSPIHPRPQLAAKELSGSDVAL